MKSAFLRFKKLKRGYYSFVILIVLMFVSLFAEFLMNNNAILVYDEGKISFPIFKYYSPKTFGLDGQKDVNYKELKIKFAKKDNAFVLMPLIPYGPYEYDLSDDTDAPPYPPSSKHLLGTDDRGRDLLVRLFYGFRISVFFAILLGILSYFIGIIAGSIMGYYGVWIDIVSQRFIEIWSSIPFLYLAIILASIFEPSFILLLLLLTAFSWTGISYYVRTEFYREKERDYIAAAKSLGLSDFRIIFKHILPNAISPAISLFPFAVVSGISMLAALDFLGYGLPSPTPSWGELFLESRTYLHHAWWIPLFTFFAITFTLLLISYIGEALRSAVDTKTYVSYK